MAPPLCVCVCVCVVVVLVLVCYFLFAGGCSHCWLCLLVFVCYLLFSRKLLVLMPSLIVAVHAYTDTIHSLPTSMSVCVSRFFRDKPDF